MSFLTRAAVGALLLSPAVLVAQTTAPAQQPATGAAPAAAATPTVGATVYDSAGAEVGRVEQVTPQAVVVNVGGNKIGVPPTSMGPGPKGLTVAATRDQLVAATQQAQAQLQAQLTPGATVRGAQGATVGTIKSNDGSLVTVTTPKGDVALPIAGFGAGPNGPVVGMTQAQIDAALAEAGAGANAAASGSADAGATAGAEAAAPAAAADAPAATTTKTTKPTKRSNR
jgi:hypothetical protein